MSYDLVLSPFSDSAITIGNVILKKGSMEVRFDFKFRKLLRGIGAVPSPVYVRDEAQDWRLDYFVLRRIA